MIPPSFSCVITRCETVRMRWSGTPVTVDWTSRSGTSCCSIRIVPVDSYTGGRPKASAAPSVSTGASDQKNAAPRRLRTDT